MRTRRNALWWGGAATLLCLGIAALQPWRPSVVVAAATPEFESPLSLAMKPLPQGESLGEAAPAAGLPAAATDSQRLAQWVQQQSILRGTQPDGDWSIGPGGQLQPSMALRRRFDHVLLLAGQLPPESLTAYLAHQASEALTSSQAAAVLQVWQRYLALQQHRFTTVARPHEPESVAQALAQRQAVRSQYLGPAWAHAFYGEEHAELADMLNGGPAAAAAQPLAPVAAEAPARLAELAAAQAQWTQRLDEARAALQALHAAPELSAPQRAAAIEQALAQRFQGGELLRAQALLEP